MTTLAWWALYSVLSFNSYMGLISSGIMIFTQVIFFGIAALICINYCLSEKVEFCKLDKGATVPSKAHEEDGWLDIFPCNKGIDYVIEPHTVKLIPTGIASKFASKYRASIGERGSNTRSTLIVMAGKIDANYTGEWFVALYNGNDRPVAITNDPNKYTDYITVPMTKAMAQVAIERSPDVVIKEADVESVCGRKTDRGAGCLGSSGR